MAKKSNKKMIFICIILIILLLAIDYFYITPKLEKPQLTKAQIQLRNIITGKFDLLDSEGNQVKSEDFNGKYRLVYFGFTNCPAICPTDLGNLDLVAENLSEKEREKLKIIFITIDPERDTKERLKSFIPNISSHIIGLTGSKEQIEKAKKSFMVYAKKVEMQDAAMAKMMGGYNVDHSTFTYFLDKDGKYIDKFEHNTDYNKIINNLRKYF